MTWESEDNSVESFELPAMTDGAKAQIAEHQIKDEDVLQIPRTGKDDKLTKSDVDAYIESLSQPEEPEDVEEFPILKIKGNGWCNELEKSYKKGFYRPKSLKEYEALKKFAE